MKTRIALMVMACLGWAACAEAETVVYNAADDFSLTNGNPNGAWSYGWCDTGVGPSVFNPYTTPTTWSGRDPSTPGIDTWTWSGGYDSSITHNGTSDSLSVFGFTWASNALGLDSYGGSSPIVRWTASQAGAVDVAATFTTMGGASTSVYVFKNFAIEYEATSTAIGASWSGTLNVAAGDIIDFAASGSTGTLTRLDATITQTVPEPATVLLVVTGMVALLAYGWRKRIGL